MPVNDYFKKARLIWEENIANLSANSVDPKISFDGGYSWMSLLAQASGLRLGSNVLGGEIKSLPDGYKQLDVNFGFTPYCIPEIINHETVSDSINGNEAGTYYFIAKCINASSPGQFPADISSDEINLTNNHSRVYKVNLTEEGKIILYITFPYHCSGICIYRGYAENDVTFPVTLNLVYVSNLTNVLLEDVTGTDSIIWLKNKFPFPNSGTVLIDSEYIKYRSCVYANKSTGSITGDFWKLTVDDDGRGANGTTSVPHTGSSGYYTEDDTPVYLANHESGFYGELPGLIYNRKKFTDPSLKQFLVFDDKFPRNLITNSSGIPLTSPSIIGTASYQENITGIDGTALSLTGTGIVDSKYTLDKTGSIQCFFSLTDVSSIDYDPVIFGNIDGFWVKVSKFNLKPYFGYGANKITSNENSYIPSLGINVINNIGISWRKDPDSDYLQIYMFIGDNEVLNYVTNILYSSFDPKLFYIGGFKLGASIEKPIKANYLDWRTYDSFLTKADFEYITQEKFGKSSKRCGKIVIDNSLPDYSIIDTQNRLIDFDPIFNLSYTFESNAELTDAGRDLGIIYDHTLLNGYLNGSYPTEEAFAYPIDPDMIQIRFDLTGDGTGFFTPIIKNIALIISDTAFS